MRRQQPKSKTLSISKAWYDRIEAIAEEDRRTVKTTAEIIFEIFFEEFDERLKTRIPKLEEANER